MWAYWHPNTEVQNQQEALEKKKRDPAPGGAKQNSNFLPILCTMKKEKERKNYANTCLCNEKKKWGVSP